ncbi:glycosyltransferase family 2 protein [uncultured Bifidobacterium sp.]|uniref:glycosyltransferase family 2 protein n=1 Tax=uncultured Bifidobacterium sp. TaxID=165187 RepID=UPI00258F6DEB|nr:glycosyltransferase family 2 protein [uncultured Bifidobacterium sp.]
MDFTGSNDIEQLVAGVLASRAYTHRQDVDNSVAAVITVEDDKRFLPQTLSAVFAQSMLPSVIVIADCTGRLERPVQTSFDVIPMPSGPATHLPDTKRVYVRIVPVSGAKSFSQAVSFAAAAAGLDPSVRCLWMLHDDSRPANNQCLESMLETWRNAPTASILGAKQLDWQGDNLHDVGRYAGHHRLYSLVVDGEPDQEQYDGRQDVFAVSLAGALVPVDTLRTLNGISPWFGTFGESADFCRRVCLSGGRVVVVPGAKIAHRRARFEGIRTRGGQALDEEDRQNTSLSRMRAEQRYAYTDIRMVWWLLWWLCSIPMAVGKAVMKLFAKQPRDAVSELAMPWSAILSFPRAINARRQVVGQTKVTPSRLGVLIADRQQIARWHDRRNAMDSQRHMVLLSPLAKAHLRQRLIRRWVGAVLMMIAVTAVVVATQWQLIRSFAMGGTLYSDQWLATGASWRQLVESATTQWVYGDGVGRSAPPTPWLLVLMAASALTFGHVATALSLIYCLCAPLVALSFWALAGIFTRSDAVRIAGGFLWVAFAGALGLFQSANLAMLTMMVFLPAAFAFVFRAVGMYHTEDPMRPKASIQAASCAALCFVVVVLSEPQTLLALTLAFLIFLIVVPSHRTMLLLIPVPAAFAVAPTLLNAIHYGQQGAWRQLFGDIAVPVRQVNGAPAALSLTQIVYRAFGVDTDVVWRGGDPQSMLRAGMLFAMLVIVVFAVISLLLPFALRSSRMMWIVAVCGTALAMVSSRVTVAVDADGQVAGSVLPGVALAMVALLSCVCLVAGGAVQRFRLLRSSLGSEETAAHAQPGQSRHTTSLVRGARGMLVIVMVMIAAAWGSFAALAIPSQHAGASTGGLPAVAVDYLRNNSDNRILALRARTDSAIEYAVMRTGKGDLLDASPATRAQIVSGETDATADTLAKASAALLSGSNDDAITTIGKLGFGGIFVVPDTSDAAAKNATSGLIANITACDGVQTVVSADSGTYYRVSMNTDSGTTQRITTTWQRRAQASVWRRLWLWCLAIIMVGYCLVALPRPGSGLMRDDEEEA